MTKKIFASQVFCYIIPAATLMHGSNILREMQFRLVKFCF